MFVFLHNYPIGSAVSVIDVRRQRILTGRSLGLHEVRLGRAKAPVLLPYVWLPGDRRVHLDLATSRPRYLPAGPLKVPNSEQCWRVIEHYDTVLLIRACLFRYGYRSAKGPSTGQGQGPVYGD